MPGAQMSMRSQSIPPRRYLYRDKRKNRTKYFFGYDIHRWCYFWSVARPCTLSYSTSKDNRTFCFCFVYCVHYFLRYFSTRPVLPFSSRDSGNHPHESVHPLFFYCRNNFSITSAVANTYFIAVHRWPNRKMNLSQFPSR